MRSQLNILALLLLSCIIFLGSCSDTDIDTPEENNCLFKSEHIVTEPICSFNPKVAVTTPFPIRVLFNGVMVANPDYNFSWSHDLDFGGSAISVTYEQLPITVTVTEVATGCVATATLDNDYWD